MAQFVHGEPVSVDYTPNADTVAGSVVVVGNTPLITHLDIPANTLGSAACEGGVYENAADAVIAAGKTVYWKNATKQLTETAAGNLRIGFTVTASGGAGQNCRFFHQPDGKAAA